MLIGSIIVAVGGGLSVTRPAVRRGCVRVCIVFLNAAAKVGYNTYPAARVDWERVRYAQWLKANADDRS